MLGREIEKMFMIIIINMICKAIFYSERDRMIKASALQFNIIPEIPGINLKSETISIS